MYGDGDEQVAPAEQTLEERIAEAENSQELARDALKALMADPLTFLTLLDQHVEECAQRKALAYFISAMTPELKKIYKLFEAHTHAGVEGKAQLPAMFAIRESDFNLEKKFGYGYDEKEQTSQTLWDGKMPATLAHVRHLVHVLQHEPHVISRLKGQAARKDMGPRAVMGQASMMPPSASGAPGGFSPLTGGGYISNNLMQAPAGDCGQEQGYAPRKTVPDGEGQSGKDGNCETSDNN